MGFGKLAFGFFLVGMGALLLGAALGYLPHGVWPWLARFWPVLLVGFGLALLANALKNALLGVFALALVAAAFVFGGWWISKHTEMGLPPTQATVINFTNPNIRMLRVQARAVGGSFAIHTQPGDPDEARMNAKSILGKDMIAHGYEAKDGVGLPGVADDANRRGHEPLRQHRGRRGSRSISACRFAPRITSRSGRSISVRTPSTKPRSRPSARPCASPWDLSGRG
jgi:hypothetical protein